MKWCKPKAGNWKILQHFWIPDPFRVKARCHPSCRLSHVKFLLATKLKVDKWQSCIIFSKFLSQPAPVQNVDDSGDFWCLISASHSPDPLDFQALIEAPCCLGANFGEISTLDNAALLEPTQYYSWVVAGFIHFPQSFVPFPQWMLTCIL